jgi:hypothetical protein
MTRRILRGAATSRHSGGQDGVGPSPSFRPENGRPPLPGVDVYT